MLSLPPHPLLLQELVTVLWSLAQLHHQPEQEWMQLYLEAATAQVSGMDGNQLSQLMWGVAQLGHQPPESWMSQVLSKVSSAVTGS